MSTELNLRDTNDLLVNPTQGETHEYLITVKHLFQKIPLMKVFDIKFLDFLFGKIQLINPEILNQEGLFPNMCLPAFNINVFVKRRRFGDTISYTCSCRHGFGLFCQSLKTIVMRIWFHHLKLHISKAISEEPVPKRFVRECYNLDNFTPDPLFNNNHPITCLYRILSNPEIKKTYAIGYERGIVTLYSQPRYLTYDVSTAVDLLESCRRKLPCRLVIIIYPFIYADIKP